jgi:hypothetical protein
MAQNYAMPGLTAGDKQQAFYQALIAAGGALSAGGAPSYEPGGVARANPGGAFMGAMNDRTQAARLRQLQGLQMAQKVAQMQQAKDAAARQQTTAEQATELHQRQKDLWPAEDAARKRALLDAQRERTFFQMGMKDMAGNDVAPPPTIAKELYIDKIKQGQKRMKPGAMRFGVINGRTVTSQDGDIIDRGNRDYYPEGTEQPQPLNLGGQGATGVASSPPLATTAARAPAPRPQPVAVANAAIAAGSGRAPVVPGTVPRKPSATGGPNQMPTPGPNTKASQLAQFRARRAQEGNAFEQTMVWDKTKGRRVWMKPNAQQQAELDAAVRTNDKLMALRIEARSNLPQTAARAEVMIQKLKELRDHPDLASIVGRGTLDIGNIGGTIASQAYMQGLAPDILTRGSGMADAQALITHVGDKAFMEAFQELKGGGQITEKEGDAAKNASSQLSATQIPLDKYKAALNQFISVIEDRVEFVRIEAGVYDGADAYVEPRARAQATGIKDPDGPGDLVPFGRVP